MLGSSLTTYMYNGKMVTASLRILGLVFILGFCVLQGEAKLYSCAQVADTIAQLEQRLLDAVINQTKAMKKAQCPDTWKRFQGSCYFFSSAKYSFYYAELVCRIYDAHFVHVQGALENAFLKSHMEELKDADYWMGLTDASIEGVFLWYDTDVPTSFADWGPSQPSNWGGNEHCTQFRSSYNFAWNDEPCASRLKFVCEKESN